VSSNTSFQVAAAPGLEVTEYLVRCDAGKVVSDRCHVAQEPARAHAYVLACTQRRIERVGLARHRQRSFAIEQPRVRVELGAQALVPFDARGTLLGQAIPGPGDDLCDLERLGQILAIQQQHVAATRFAGDVERVDQVGLRVVVALLGAGP
jgi:hypothetical protein